MHHQCYDLESYSVLVLTTHTLTRVAQPGLIRPRLEAQQLIPQISPLDQTPGGFSLWSLCQIEWLSSSMSS